MGRYFAVTIDPLHIGAGGYRLGRVDNTIVRDAGTGIPKIPGSSLAGTCRSHVLSALPDDEKRTALDCARLDGEKKGNCGKPDCPICQIFGHAAAEAGGKSRIGRVKFFDGVIVAFPVATLAGPVWVSSPTILAQAGCDCPTPAAEELLVNFDLPGKGTKLNLGWLYLPASKNEKIKLPIEGHDRFSWLSERVAVAPDWLFAELVNSNLEVRTSVSIDFETGAASEGKLFTYEAIPASTLLRFDVELDERRCVEPWTAERVLTRVQDGLKLLGVLGMGGMNTRGFGRLRVLGLS